MRGTFERWKHRNPGPDKVWSVLLWVCCPLLAVYMLSLAPSALEASLAASRGEGIRGTFVAEREDCGGRGGCTYYGRFSSNDGRVQFPDVLIDNGPKAVGDTLPALYEGERNPPKVYELGSKDWMYVVGLTAGSAAYLTGWGWAMVRLARFGPRPE